MGSDKTEKPTPKKKREARREGKIARSQDVVAWTALLVGTWLLTATVASTGHLLQDVLHRSQRAIQLHDTHSAMAVFGAALRGALVAAAPLIGGLMVVGVVGNIAQVGWAPTTKTLAPKFSKVNPLSGLKRMFSPNGIWEVAKSALKVALLAGLTWSPLKAIATSMAMRGQVSIFAAAPEIGAAGLALVRRIAFGGLAIAAADYMFQRRRINKSIMMTKQEIKDEHKQSEGSPEAKGEIRSRQIKMSRNRMIASVPNADVVLVNPTHVAVALKYEPQSGAPRVIAKGADAVADRIREVARENGIPLVQDIPLTRTIFRACDIDDEIPADLYEAVARVLAFVFGLRSKAVTHEPYRVPGAIAVPMPA
jgi:flagellar biosynthetic protein FlhB